MSEFKFACPVCSQHIVCDSSQAGAEMECPTCFQKITVPQAPTTENQKYILTGTKSGRTATKIASRRTAVPDRIAPVLLYFFGFLILVAAVIAAVVFHIRSIHNR